MIRLKARLPHHSLPKQILALALAWLTVAGGLPSSTLSSPMPAVPPLPLHTSLAAALPAPEPQSAEPAPLPSPSPQDKPAEAKKKEDEAKKNEEEAKKWGEITVGQPKIWQYERVNSLLDGLLRDVQGVSMSDLVSLDANATNGAAVKFVQSMLEIGVKYDQGAAVTNAIALKNYAATQGIASAQIQANSTYLQQLYAQRTSVTGQLLAATQQNAALQGQLATTDPTGAEYKPLTTQQQSAASEVTGLQGELTSINNQISAASATTIPPAPSLASTSANPAPESANTFSSFLSGLPSGLTTNLVNQLQSPSLPATKRMDNFMTLLYERLAREISVLQDDVMRDPDNVAYLVQFDVGLYPGVRAKNHVGVVEFTMDCDGCKVYSVYPGQSSYNLANYEAASKRYSIWGALSTIFGLGVSADYRRQTDTLHGDLVQSVYISGFQDDTPNIDRITTERTTIARADDSKVVIPTERFGWYYGAAPFETLVSPGVRSTFSIVSVPRRLLANCRDNQVKCQADCRDNQKNCQMGITLGTENDTGYQPFQLSIHTHTD